MLNNLVRLLTFALIANLGDALANDSSFASKVGQVSSPNIVLILADDLGYGDVGCYNPESRIPTPNLDRLALGGMRFTDAHSPCTVCTPTRYSLMTGQMAFRVPNGGRVFSGVGGPSLITPNRMTLPQLLREQGYSTACVGKWHIGLTFYDNNGQPIHKGDPESVNLIDYTRRIDGGPLDCGFDQFFGTACCPTTDWLYAFIDGDRIPVPPTALLDKTKLPKHPYANDNRRGWHAPDFDLEEVDMKFLEKSRQVLHRHVDKYPNKPFFLYHATQAVHLPSFPGKDYQGKTQSGPHGDFIFEFDHIVGELMKTLRELGVADNTLVIVTSDNGPEVPTVVHMRQDHNHDGARPWRGVKRDNWEGGHRVPFIISWPGKLTPGSTSAQITSLCDVFATVADLVGTKLPDNTAEDSFSLLPILSGNVTEPIRPYLLQQAFTGSRDLAIRRDKWKYLAHKGSGGNNYETNPELKQYALPDTEPTASGQLYDLESDPGETTNLALKHPKIATELETLLKQSIASGRSRPLASNDAPEVIFHNAQIITVDKEFSIQQAVAISGENIVAVGKDDQVLRLAGPATKRVDLRGKTLLPGLIDSHVHATDASMHEFDHAIPTMQTIDDVLAYIQSRVDVVDDGQWITVSQVFITRLDDQRFPNRKELDRVAPNNPVFFRTGPDAALNSMALRLSGIDKDFQIPEGINGRIELDPTTGEPTGIIRSAEKFLKVPTIGAKPSDIERKTQLKRLLADYNSVGITSISDRNASDDAIQIYESLKETKELNCRLFLYYEINAAASMYTIKHKIRKATDSPLHTYNNRLWLRGVKVFLDGGMLTGSAYMQIPWGVSSIYGIHDAEYRGVRYIDPEKLYAISKLALSNDLQMTAHSVGDAAVELLVKTYEAIDRDDFSIRDKRPCVTHCNFMSPDVIDTMAKLGIVADLQPVWLWLDGKTLRKQFGEDRMRYFQPYRTLFEKQVIVGGGSDHMQKIGSLRSVNPYNPFLGMWIAMKREPRSDNHALHPAQSISREQAIRLYTMNNAWLSFEETKKGSIEQGKLADMIVLETDILSCPLEHVKDIQVHQTYVGGKLVYQKP